MQQIQLIPDLSLSRVVVGNMRLLDAGLKGEALLRFVKQCLDMGMDTFDHAPVYGGYTCESIFGDAVLRVDPGIRSKIKLVTKTGIVLPNRRGNSHICYDARKKTILQEMDESLRRLGTDHVDLLLVHRPDPLTDPAETADALATLLKEGKTLAVGVSNYTPAQTTALQKYLSVPLATNQLEFSVKNTDAYFDGTVDDLFTRGMKPMAWSPLGGGSVFKGTDAQSERLRTVLNKLALHYGVTMDVIMYAWLFSHPLHMLVVTGTLQIERIRCADEALKIHLTHDEWYEVLAASRGFDVP